MLFRSTTGECSSDEAEREEGSDVGRKCAADLETRVGQERDEEDPSPTVTVRGSDQREHGTTWERWVRTVR